MNDAITLYSADITGPQYPPAGANTVKALAEGVPTSEVSRWLGHKSTTTTVDLYGHLVPEASGRARDALDKAFQAGSQAP